MKKTSKLTLSQKDELAQVIQKYDSKGPEVRRCQAIILLDNQTDIKIIKRLIGFSRKHIFTLRANYLKHGLSAIIDKREGQPKELLTKKQRIEVVDKLKNKTPRDFGYQADHWITAILGHFIQNTYKVKYKSKTSYYLIFRQAKFTYHKPGRVYHKRNEQEVLAWRKQTKPIITKAFKDPNTVILTEDEMLLSTQNTTQKIWLPQGEYPKIEINIKKENRSIYGFLNVKTGQEHAFKTQWQNMYLTCKILKKIRKIYPKKKLLILWDGAGWHRGFKVQEFIKQDKNIQTIYFPRYAPEEDPQEHVWKSGRNKVTHNRFIQNIDQATDEFVNYLNSHRFNYSLLGFSAIS